MRRRGRYACSPATARRRIAMKQPSSAPAASPRQRPIGGPAVPFIDTETGKTTMRRPLSAAPVIGADGSIVGISMMWVEERR